MMGKRARLETAVWAGKLLLLCVGIVSTMVFFRVAVIPYLHNLTLSTLPHLWTSIRSYCLSPLYIYIILNFIIIIIALTSTFQNQKPSTCSYNSVPSSYSSINNTKAASTIIDSTSTADEYKSNNQLVEIETSSSHSENAAAHDPPLSSLLTHQFSNEMISWHDIHILQQAASTQEVEEESIRIMSSSTTVDPSPEEEPSSSSSDQVEDSTLDTTWNAIMERQGKPISKQLKKSETWDTPPRKTHLVTTRFIQASREEDVEDHQSIISNKQNNNNNVIDDRVAWARKELKKSDTFSDRVSMIREKSMTQDELNQRAEAFINKINNQMRLQRLESDQRFRDMVHSGL